MISVTPANIHTTPGSTRVDCLNTDIIELGSSDQFVRLGTPSFTNMAAAVVVRSSAMRSSVGGCVRSGLCPGDLG